jgi:hypothetical protein
LLCVSVELQKRKEERRTNHRDPILSRTTCCKKKCEFY